MRVTPAAARVKAARAPTLRRISSKGPVVSRKVHETEVIA